MKYKGKPPLMIQLLNTTFILLNSTHKINKNLHKKLFTESTTLSESATVATTLSESATVATTLSESATVSTTEFFNESFTENFLRLPDNVIPKHYEIQFELDVEKDIFSGTANVSIIINKATQFIYLHSKKLNVTRLIIFKKNATKTEPITHIKRYHEEIECIALYFNNLLLPGRYTVKMKFMGLIDNMGGFFKTSYINENGIREWFITTQTWPTGARRMFPCWDELRFKARFTITIKHNINYTALCNTLKSSLLINNNTALTHFLTTPAIPTYLVVIVLCKLPRILFNNINSIWRSRMQFIDQKFIFRFLRQIDKHFQKEWKQLEKPLINNMLQHVAIPGLLDNGMEKWNLVFYREEDINYNKELDPLARKIEMTYLIGRKISRQWLSTVVSPSWWSHLWLNEGIATYVYIADVVNKIIPRMSDLLQVQTMQESLHLDVQSIMNPLKSKIKSASDINSLLSFSYYIKAPVIMRMLQCILSDKVFRNGINIYLKRKMASLDDFWTDMQTAYHEASIGKASIRKFNITVVMNPWIRQKSYPVLLILRYRKYINIINVLSHNVSRNWEIPVTYTTNTDLNFNNSSPIIWNPRKSQFIELHSSLENDWVIFNLQQTGYYRVNYNKANWQSIIHYLNFNTYKEIHVLNRAQIIDDAFHFMITGQINASIFWELTCGSYLTRERNYIVWYPMIKAIESISYIFLFSENKNFKIMIRNQLVPHLQRIGYTENPEGNRFTRCFRQEVAKWACVLGDPKCKREAVSKLKWHLENPINNKLLPWWRKWTYCNGLAVADDITLKKVFNISLDEFLTEKDTRKLEYLACSNEHSYILSFIKKIKSRSSSEHFLNSKQVIKDYINLFQHIIVRHAKNDSLLDYLLSNWEKVKPKEISTIVALTYIINNVYSVKQLHKIKEFIKNMERESLTINKYFDLDDLNLKLLFNKKKIQELIKDIKDTFIQISMILQSKINKRMSEIKKLVDSYSFIYT